MKKYTVNLACIVPKTFLTQMACNSVDMNPEEKSVHQLSVEADLDTPYNIGLILGASGSGKSSLARSIFGESWDKDYLDLNKPIIEQFPKDFKYEEIVDYLNGVGLSQVPCWVRPAFTLSNGQRARAEVALIVANTPEGGTAIIDEFTSVVDRTVGKIMSHAIQRFVRLKKIKMVLISCHRDVFEFINPCWVIDCDNATYLDRRLLSPTFKRTEQLAFEIAKVDKSHWESFKQFHYLSSKLPGGAIHSFGLFHEGNLIGMLVLANYVPHRKGALIVWHVARIVLRPDYVGLSLSRPFTEKVCEHFKSSYSCKIRASFSSKPYALSLMKSPSWKFLEKRTLIGKQLSGKMRLNYHDTKIFSRLKKRDTFRKDTILYRFEWR